MTPAADHARTAQDVAALDLHHLPIAEQSFAADPDPHMLAARARHAWLAASDFGVVITDYAACNDILRMDNVLKTPAEHIVAIMGGAGTNWARFQVECLIARDGDDHARLRSAVHDLFTPRAVSIHRERIQTVVAHLLDEWAPRGRFDFEAFASHFPIAVMFGLVGAPLDRITEVKASLEIVGQSFSLDRTLFPAIEASFQHLWGFVGDLIEHRLAGGASGEGDLLDALIATEREARLSHTELCDLLILLFVAGYDTSKNQLSHIVHQLLEKPGLWERCAIDRAFCDQVVEEALRHSGVATSYRNVRHAFTYREVAFPAAAMLIFPMGIVCRYSGPFQHSQIFNPERGDALRHTAFSRGMHMCLGQFLARLQIAEGLHLIAQRLRNLRQDGPPVWRLFPGVWGPKHLPIAFDPKPAC